MSNASYRMLILVCFGRAFVVGDVFQPLVLVFDDDTEGKRRVTHVSLQGTNVYRKDSLQTEM